MIWCCASTKALPLIHESWRRNDRLFFHRGEPLFTGEKGCTPPSYNHLGSLSVCLQKDIQGPLLLSTKGFQGHFFADESFSGERRVSLSYPFLTFYAEGENATSIKIFLTLRKKSMGSQVHLTEPTLSAMEEKCLHSINWRCENTPAHQGTREYLVCVFMTRHKHLHLKVGFIGLALRQQILQASWENAFFACQTCDKTGSLTQSKHKPANSTKHDKLLRTQ